MFQRIFLGLSAVMALLAYSGTAEAGWRRCVVTCYTPCCPCPCPCPDPCPKPHCCCVYKYSGPVEPLYGPYTPITRLACTCQGIIVQVDVPTGVKVMPTDVFKITQSVPGAMKYEGYNKVMPPPGHPGAPIRYSFFFCPQKACIDHVEIGFEMSDGKIKYVPFDFSISSNIKDCP